MLVAFLCPKIAKMEVCFYSMCLVFHDFNIWFLTVKIIFKISKFLVLFWQLVDDFCYLDPNPSCGSGSRRSPICNADPDHCQNRSITFQRQWHREVWLPGVNDRILCFKKYLRDIASKCKIDSACEYDVQTEDSLQKQ